jgi:hypothetical protein
VQLDLLIGKIYLIILGKTEMQIVTLNHTEQLIVQFIAKQRFKSNRESGVKDRKVDQNTEMPDLNGFGAEMAFCKIFNLYPDFSIEPRKGTYDVLNKKGERVDIKTTKYRNGHLLALKTKTKKDCDIYILVVGEFPSYQIAGSISSEELLQETNIKDLGYGNTYAVSQDKLLPIEEPE